MKRLSSRRCFISVVLLAASLTDLPAQDVVTRLSYSNRCGTCRVSLERVVTLGSTSDPDSLWRTGIVRDSRGRFFAIGSSGHSVIVFDSTGKYLQSIRPVRAAQRLTSSLVLGPGDTVFALPGVVFGPDLQQARTIEGLPAEGLRTLSLMPDEQFLISYVRTTSTSVGAPFHIFDKNGNFVRSFGADTTIRPQRPLSRTLPFLNDWSRQSIWTYTPGLTPMRLTRHGIIDGSKSTVEVTDFPHSVLAGPIGFVAPTLLLLNRVQNSPNPLGNDASGFVDVFDTEKARLMGTAEIQTNAGVNLVPGTDLLVSYGRISGGTRFRPTIWRLVVSDTSEF